MADASQQSKLRVIEAVLFLAKDGMSSRKLAKLAGLADATEARTLIRELNEIYDQDGRSFRVEDIAGGYMLLTRSNFATWLRRLQHAPAENRLSQTLLETLAIVAYRQPVLRAEIEAIRGVGSSDSLRQLMEMDLIRISGRSEDLGRPYLYGTTRRFLQMFGLRSADRLPRRAWVNELQLSLTSSDTESSDSGAKESSVTASLTTTALLAEDGDEASTRLLHENNSDLKASVDDDDEYFEEDFDDEDDDDEGFDAWEDDGEVDEEESDEVEDSDDDDDEEDDDDEDDDLEEEQPEWKEVDDDDDGWEDDDDDEESEWDSEEEDDDEDWE